MKSEEIEEARENIATLLRGIDRYNPGNIEHLEKYIELQVTENVYDCEANLAVLKLYQFNPSHYQTNVTIKILLKAIANLPHPDFSLCKYLIEPDKLREEPLSSVVALGNQLETCDFEEFWQSLASTKSSIPAIGSVFGFTDSVRKFICHVKIKTDQLCRILDIKRDQLAVYLEEYGWKLVPDDPSHVFVFNYEETIKTRNISEKIGFPQVKQLAPVLQNAASDCHKRAK
uniref:Eukaryotic translation initiation factor 3 subunit K n=1 Tax=Macrostomum lignano TaxID=282301 RepID=A0A1I8IR23_9PLAT